jgi:hypothetical protein
MSSRALCARSLPGDAARHPGRQRLLPTRHRQSRRHPGQPGHVPASEIIHDRFNCLFHPLVGLSPVFAAGLAATQGLKIQNHSASFFDKGAMPSGMLTAPGRITQDVADRLKADWREICRQPECRQAGRARRRPGIQADDDERGRRAAHRPAEMVGRGGLLHLPCAALQDRHRPAADLQQCPGAQHRILFAMPAGAVRIGRGAARRGPEYRRDLGHRVRHRQSAAHGQRHADGGARQGQERDGAERGAQGDQPAAGGRRRQRLPPAAGFSLEALAKRDAKEDPFAKAGPSTSSAAPPPAANDDEEQRQAVRALFKERLAGAVAKQLREALHAA